MPNENIKLRRMIVHKVDHKKYDEPQFSDLDSPVDDDDVSIFFREHIVNGKDHLYARSGVFSDTAEKGKTDFQGICDQLLSSPQDFVPCSKQIAQHLFDTVKSDQRISAGDLIVAIYTDSDLGDDIECLALLKMDPDDGFVSEVQEINGQVQIVLKRVKNVLPNGELQKCAFILPATIRKPVRHLIVLDQQVTNRGGNRMVATFFISDFLQCKVDLNNKEKTTAFFYGSRDFRDSKKGEWSEPQRENFDNTIEAALQNASIDVAAVARIALPDPPQQEEFVEYVRGQMRADGFDDLVFEPVSNFYNQKNYVVIEGDEDLKIRVLAEAVGEGKMLEFTENKATGKTEIKIQTTEFKKKEQRGKR